MSEQTFTKDQVTQIVRMRVNKKNERIEALEIEIAILKVGVDSYEERTADTSQKE